MSKNSNIYTFGENPKISIKTTTDKSKIFNKLLSTSRVGDYLVECKYAEASKNYISRRSNKECNTPLQIVQTIQIKVLDSEQIIKVYEIRTSNRNRYMNEIIMVQNGYTLEVLKDRSEWQRFEHILKELEHQIDRFSWESINLALEIITGNNSIWSTPNHVKFILRKLNNKQNEMSKDLVTK
jgi:hypothetical protein